MEISPEPTCPGHKGNQESLNEDEAGRPTRTLIYFIFLSYFISVTSDTAQQQVYPERIPRARRRAWVLWRPPGACSRLLSWPAPGGSLERQSLSPPGTHGSGSLGWARFQGFQQACRAALGTSGQTARPRRRELAQRRRTPGREPVARGAGQPSCSHGLGWPRRCFCL